MDEPRKLGARRKETRSLCKCIFRRLTLISDVKKSRRTNWVFSKKEEKKSKTLFNYSNRLLLVSDVKEVSRVNGKGSVSIIRHVVNDDLNKLLLLLLKLIL